MEKIIDPISKQLIKKELTDDLWVRKTNKANRSIYIFTHDQAPNTFKELGRLREITFREAGGGTGKSMDIDKYDTAASPFKQLIVWDDENEEIVGGYRYIEGNKIPLDKNGVPQSPTSKLFRFSEQFIAEYLPYTIELGRSFIQPEYQPTKDLRKGLYSLDNLWDGLGSILDRNRYVKYYFGKFTMYRNFDPYARDLLHVFLHKYFKDTQQLVMPHQPLLITHDKEELLSQLTGKDFEEDNKIMGRILKEKGERVPPLVNAYMNLSSTMKIFGTAINSAFGEVEESAIMVTVADIYHDKKVRYKINFEELGYGE